MKHTKGSLKQGKRRQNQLSIEQNAAPIIYFNPKSKPVTFYEKGNQDIDYWYYWAKTPLLKEDYEPVREENVVTGTTDTVLTRWGWNHKYWTDLLFVDDKIEVIFMGPGKTPFIRTNENYNQIIFEAYLKTHPNIVRDANSKCIAGCPPAYYKTPGKKLHFPDIVKIYGGWPALR